MAVQGILPVQQTIQGQCSADVVQSKDAVGVSYEREKCLGTRAPQQVGWGFSPGSKN